VVAAIGDLAKDPVEAPAVIELPPDLERWQREGFAGGLAESKPAFAKSSRRWLRRGMPRSVCAPLGEAGLPPDAVERLLKTFGKASD